MSRIRRESLNLADVEKGLSNFEVNVEQYLSVNDIAEDCAKRSVVISSYDMKNESYDSNFHGVHDYAEALELMRFGYQPTVDDISEKMKTSKHHAEKRIGFDNNIYGFAPVVPLALMGIPNSMVNVTIKPIKFKVIDLYYDCGAVCCYSSNQMIEAGAKMLSTILNLEQQGYRFNLYIAASFCDRDGVDILLTKVKDSDKPLDLKRISFSLAHSAYFRVIGFDWQSKSPVARYLGWGRGKSLTQQFHNDDLSQAIYTKMFGKNAVYCSSESIIDDGMDHIIKMIK